MNIYCLQHEAHEGPGAIEAWASFRNHRFIVTRVDRGETLPSPCPGDGLVVMGGSMNVDQETDYPWLDDEKKSIAAAIDRGATVLGICLGAQLIARVLGAKVLKNRHPEIGWFPVEKTAHAGPLFDLFPSKLSVFHWHGDTFDLPVGATHAMRSEACLHQAFLYRDRVVGLQFHLEVTREMVVQMIEVGGNSPSGPFVQSPEVILAPPPDLPNQFDHLHALLHRWLDTLFIDRGNRGLEPRSHVV